MEDKSLFFITLSVICIWLVVDSALGENYIKKFLGTIFPFMDDESNEKTESTLDKIVPESVSKTIESAEEKTEKYMEEGKLNPSELYPAGFM